MDRGFFNNRSPFVPSFLQLTRPKPQEQKVEPEDRLWGFAGNRMTLYATDPKNIKLQEAELFIASLRPNNALKAKDILDAEEICNIGAKTPRQHRQLQGEIATAVEEFLAFIPPHIARQLPRLWIDNRVEKSLAHQGEGASYYKGCMRLRSLNKKNIFHELAHWLETGGKEKGWDDLYQATQKHFIQRTQNKPYYYKKYGNLSVVEKEGGFWKSYMGVVDIGDKTDKGKALFVLKSKRDIKAADGLVKHAGYEITPAVFELLTSPKAFQIIWNQSPRNRETIQIVLNALYDLKELSIHRSRQTQKND